MDEIFGCTNTRVIETIARLQQSDNFKESSKYTWVKKTDKVEIYALFGLMYFQRILGVNLHMTDKIFSNDIHFVFGAIMSKNRFISSKNFSKATFVLTIHKKKRSFVKQIDSQLLERSGKSSIRIFQSILHHRNIFQLMRNYTQWDKKLHSTIIIPLINIVMVCYWSHWMMQNSLYIQSCTICCKTKCWR